jgi:hypothetical protein
MFPKKNKKFNKTYNNRFPKRRRRSYASSVLAKMNYQQRGGMQTLGPGILVKNYEATIPIIQSQLGTFTLEAMLGEQWQKDFASFTYFKIIAVAVIQQRINTPNSAGNVTILFNFNRSIEGEIISNDSAKIFPPVGAKQFVYRPGRGIVYVTKTADNDSTNRPLNLSVYNATSNVLISDVYRLPGILATYSTASTTRFVRVVLRIAYRGSFEPVSTSKLQVSNRVKEMERIVKEGIVIKKQVLNKTLLEKEIDRIIEEKADDKEA